MELHEFCGINGFGVRKLGKREHKVGRIVLGFLDWVERNLGRWIVLANEYENGI